MQTYKSQRALLCKEREGGKKTHTWFSSEVMIKDSGLKKRSFIHLYVTGASRLVLNKNTYGQIFTLVTTQMLKQTH